MVGTEFTRQFPKDPAFEYLPLPEFDVTQKDNVREIFRTLRPAVVVHLAAITDVDGCEKNPADCLKVNVEATRTVANASQAIGALMVYPSTFYIYPGEKDSPYDERYDAIDPKKIVGVYSRSKWEGEEAVRSVKDLKHLIVRFGALFGGGSRDKKFVAKVIGLVKSGQKTIQMVNDRVIQPTYVKDTVLNLMAVIRQGGAGTFNMVGKGQATYFEYARAILEFSGVHGVEVVPIASQDFKENAPRPKNLTAVNGRLAELGWDRMRDWKVALKEYLEDYKEELWNEKVRVN